MDHRKVVNNTVVAAKWSENAIFIFLTMGKCIVRLKDIISMPLGSHNI